MSDDYPVLPLGMKMAPIPDTPGAKNISGVYPKPQVEIPDGGPAFPMPPSAFSEGMSLRDYFAAAALTGFLALYADPNSPMPDEQNAAQTCYEFADALIKEREKGK